MMISLALAVGVLALLYAFGNRLLTVCGSIDSKEESLLWSFGIGTAVFSYIFFLLGIWSHLDRLSVAGLLLIMFLVGISRLAQLPSQIKTLMQNLGHFTVHFLKKKEWLILTFIVLYAVQIFINLLNALAPPIEGDTLHTYLTLPKWWALGGSIRHVPNALFNGMYGVAFMLSALGAVFHDDRLPLLIVGFSFGLISSGSVYVLTRKLGGPVEAGVAAATLFLCLPDVWYESATAKVDIVALLMNLLAVLALIQTSWSPRRRAAWAGFFTGASIWTKLACLEMFLAMVPLILLLSNRDGGDPSTSSPSIMERLQHLGLYAGIAAIAALPGAVFNWHLYGNPLYPVGVGIFTGKGEGVMPFVSNRLAALTDHYYSGWSGIFLAILRNTYVDRFHGYGPIFFAFLPFFLWALIQNRSFRRLGLFMLIYLPLWNYIRQLSRDMIILLVIQIAVISSALWGPLSQQLSLTGRRVLKLLALASCLPLITQNLMTAVFFERPHYVFSQQTKEEYLERILTKMGAPIPRWDMIRAVNNHIPHDAMTLNLLTGNTYYFDFPLITNSPVINQIVQEKDEARLVELLRGRSIRYIVVSQRVYQQLKNELALLFQPAFLHHHAMEVFSNPDLKIFRFDV